MANYYYSKNDSAQGPFSLSEIELLCRSGSIVATTDVIREGEEKWTPCGEHPEIGALLEKSSPDNRVVAGLLCLRVLLYLACIGGLFAASNSFCDDVEREVKEQHSFIQDAAKAREEWRSISTNQDYFQARNKIESLIQSLENKRVDEPALGRQQIDKIIDAQDALLGHLDRIAPKQIAYWEDQRYCDELTTAGIKMYHEMPSRAEMEYKETVRKLEQERILDEIKYGTRRE